MNLEIHKMLVLSTGHLTRSTLDWFEGHPYVNDYGLFLYTDYTLGHEDCTLPDVIQTLAFATLHGCTWVKFDCDGPEVEGLPVYDHSTEET